MTQLHVDYDTIATHYDRRYEAAGHHERIEALLQLASTLHARKILEVGCGTGYWLEKLAASGYELHGLDRSTGMLRQALRRSGSLCFACGLAEHLPYGEASFDLIFCVQAVHHFAQPCRFVRQAFRVLGPGGVLAIVGSDPRLEEDEWYIYDFFRGTYVTDLARKPSWQTFSVWLEEAGFEDIELTTVERICDPKRGQEVLDDPFLQKNGCSQLALLTTDAYMAGLARIKAALEAASAKGEQLIFPCSISIAMLSGQKPH